MVGHILQYHPAVTKLKELVDAGELGKIQYLYSNRLNIGKIRAEENILWSFAPHDISVILMLLGERPETVYASGGSYLQHQIPDTTLTTLDFPSGVKAHIFVSWLHPFKEQKLVVVGDKKMAVFDDVSQEKLLLYPHKIEWLHRIPVAAKAESEIVEIEMDEPLRAECRHFLQCVAEGTTPTTDGREGLSVLQVLEASQESLNQDGCKIRLDFKAPVLNSLSPDSRDYFVHESSYIDEKNSTSVFYGIVCYEPGYKQSIRKSDLIYSQVDVSPTPEKGIDSFYKFIIDNLKYPEAAKNEGIEGKVWY